MLKSDFIALLFFLFYPLQNNLGFTSKLKSTCFGQHEIEHDDSALKLGKKKVDISPAFL